MTESHNQQHPDAETLALFAEGKLKRADMTTLLAHLDRCTDCIRALRGANEELAQRSSGSRNPFRLAIAAAIAVAIVGAAAMVWTWQQRAGSPAARLVALVPRDERNVEPRLSGGFAWAPYRGPVRANGASPRPADYRLGGVAGELLERAERDDAPGVQHAAGTALILVERPHDAIAKLRAAAEREPRNATLWNDLGAAEYAHALRSDRPSGYPEALAAFDRALKLEPQYAEALFNRALTLERLGASAAAREAWQRYLRVDGTSPWATEARARLRKLVPSTGESRFRGEQPRLERAAIDGDRPALLALVRQFPQPARSFGEAEYLGLWGEAELRGDGEEAAHQLTIARAIGAALARTSGESLLHDAVRVVDGAAPSVRRTLAEAHALYRSGRLAYSRQAPVSAEPELRRAAALFASAGSPMAEVARYFAANTRFDQNDVAGARRELEALLRVAAARPRHQALGAQIRWELALCAMNDDDWGGALPLLTESERAFRALGERSNRGFIETLLADALVCLGRPDDGWAARIRSFQTLSAGGWGDRLAVSIGGAARMEMRGGRLEAARSLSSIELAALRGSGNDASLANALMRAAVLDAELGDDGAAWESVREAETAASRLTDPAMRKRATADVQLARGAVLLRRDPRAASGALANAIAGYVETEAPLFLPESHLLHARALVRLGDAEGALREVEQGIAVYERHRFRFAPSVAGTGVHDAATSLYGEAIRLTLDRGDAGAAFGWQERALQQLGAGDAAARVHDVQQRLRGSGAVVLSLAMLEREVAAFVVSERAIDVQRKRADGRELARLGEASCGGDLDAARALYDLLIRPVEKQLAAASRVIVVAGARLEPVPFAALYDATTKQRLIERMPVALAPSASALRAEKTAAARTVLAVGVRSDALPESRAELDAVARVYPRAIDAGGARATFASLVGAAARADVIHISGHADRYGRTGEATFVFAGERVSWRRIASAMLPREPVVVLAACETLRASPSSRARALSLGGGFLAAGAGDIIGTLTPIPDNDAHAIFARIHRHLAAGHPAADALRLAQLESLAAEGGGVRNAWRSVALITRRIPITKEAGS